MIIYGLDISMSNCGVAIFEDNKPIYITHIKTNAKQTHGQRLKHIYNELSKIISKYEPNIVCIESGFTRHNKSTQAVYKVHGVVELLFHNKEIVHYAPMTVKKALVSGKASKEEVKAAILQSYPDIKFHDDDESDAVAIVITYLKDVDIL